MGGISSPAAFSAKFESTQAQAVASTLFTFPHSLGGAPRMFDVIWECKTADIGWAAGDRCLHSWSEGTGNYSLAAWADATNLYVRLPGQVQIQRKDTAVAALMTLANWYLVVRAAR